MKEAVLETNPHAQGGLGRLVGKWWFWAILVGALFTLPLARALMRDLPPSLPRLGEMTPFATTVVSGARAGETYDAGKELSGRVWIATFVEPGDALCDQLGNGLDEIQHRAKNLGDDWRMVSFVAPGVDRAAVEAYSKRHHANVNRWYFVVDAPPAENVLGDAMIRGALLPPSSVSGPGRVHKPHVAALIDRRGRIRGFYDPTSEAGRDALLMDVGLVINLDEP